MEGAVLGSAQGGHGPTQLETLPTKAVQIDEASGTSPRGVRG